MWKWLMKKTVVAFAEPIVDAILDALDSLAGNTATNIDDIFVARLRELRDVIISFIISNVDEILETKKLTKR